MNNKNTILIGSDCHYNEIKKDLYNRFREMPDTIESIDDLHIIKDKLLAINTLIAYSRLYIDGAINDYQDAEDQRSKLVEKYAANHIREIDDESE